jgi:hypothetical protein
VGGRGQTVDEGGLMRGLWDSEKTMTPGVLRSAMGLVGGFLALSAAVMIGIAVASASQGFYAAAAMQFAAGVALPFGIWLALRILADMVVLMNRSHDRLEAIERLAGGPLPPETEQVVIQNGATARAEGGAGFSA